MSDNTKPRRVQRRRTKGYRLPENTVSVTRPGKWGNPFRVVKQDGRYWIVDSDGNYWREYEEKARAVERTVELFSNWIEGKIDSGQLTISELRGKHLACFCAEGSPCHADVLLKLANQ